MMKEGRGRSDSGGNFLLSKTIDNWYFEVNTLLENGSTLYTERSSTTEMDLTTTIKRGLRPSGYRAPAKTGVFQRR